MPDNGLHTTTRQANAPSVRRLATISVMIGAPVAALHAAGGNGAVKDIRGGRA